MSKTSKNSRLPKMHISLSVLDMNLGIIANIHKIPGHFKDTQHQPGHVHDQEYLHSDHNNPGQVHILPLDQSVSRAGHP